jgi:succinate dehydrogenase hydrophobic anchor subunit
MLRDLSKPGLSEFTLFRIQAGSGILFATFLVLHLSNTMLASAGQTTYDAYQGTLRWYYQFPLIEILVIIGAATVHAWAGLTRGWRRVRNLFDPQAERFVPPLRVRLHRWCGYIILLIIPGHISATRMPSLIEGLPVDFSFVYFSIKHWPWFFYPYLLAYGVSLGIFRVTPPGWGTDEKSKPFWTAFVASSLLVIVGILSLGGNFFAPTTDRFPELKAFYETKFQKIFMPWKEEP